MKLLSQKFGCLLAALFVSSCSLAPERDIAPGAIAFEPCHISGIQDLSECGFLQVPEDWNNPAQAKIDVHVVRLPPSGGQPILPPLFVLAGGPGEAASSYGPFISSALAKLRRGREIILVDQRGSGKSAPFACSWDGIALNATGADLAQRCASDRTRKLQHYSTQAFANDLEAVRVAMGFETIHLWGGSYGTRAALIYAREYESAVGAMVLDSVAPPTIHLLERDSETFSNALEKTFADCELDDACASAFPELRATFEDLRISLRALPKRVTTKNGQLDIDDQIFVTGLQSYLYQPSFAAAIPYIIDAASRRDFKPWQALSSDDVYGSLSPALTLSVQCAEEAPRTDKARIRDTAFRSNYVALMEGACANWPVPNATEFMRVPLSAEFPVLLLAGALDPVTPPSFAIEAVKTLPNAQILTAPAAGHAVSMHGCASELIARFLDANGQVEVDGSCLRAAKRPPFILSANGPQV